MLTNYVGDRLGPRKQKSSPGNQVIMMRELFYDNKQNLRAQLIINEDEDESSSSHRLKKSNRKSVDFNALNNHQIRKSNSFRLKRKSGIKRSNQEVGTALF
jgi:hypothetical protein